MGDRIGPQLKPARSIHPTSGGGVLQRKCACGNHAAGGECEECRKKKLQRKGVNSELDQRDDYFIPPIVHEVLRPGQPLNAGTRAYMVPRFEHDFSNVRVHAGSASASAAQAIDVLGLTLGEDIAFGAGQRTSQPRTCRLRPVGLRHDGSTLTADHEAVRNAETIAVSAYSSSKTTMNFTELQRVSADHPGGGHSSTLPYREATELATCLRIMGEDNAEYCRNQVTGEQPTGPVKSPACTPISLARPDYLAQPGTTEQDFGLTELKGQVVIPVVQVTKVKGGVEVDQTDASLPPVRSVVTRPGSFIEGKTILVSQGNECPSKKYDIHWTIFPDGAQKIREAEQEHCSDFQYAFQISLQRYASAVNALSKSNRVFANQRDVEVHLTRTLGVVPSKWAQVFSCLASKTKLRDNAKWHTPSPTKVLPDLRNACADPKFNISAASLPAIGQHPPSEIIKGCGEKP